MNVLLIDFKINRNIKINKREELSPSPRRTPRTPRKEERRNLTTNFTNTHEQED